MKTSLGEKTDLSTMKICIIAPEFLPIWGGTGSYIVELLKNLPEEVDVHVVTLSRKISGLSEGRMNPSEIINRDIQIHFISNANETLFYNLGFQTACFRKIPKLHNKYRFDVLHSQFGHMSDVLLRVFQKIRIPTVTTVHGTIALLREVLSSNSRAAKFSDLEWSEKQVQLFYPALRTLELSYAKHIHTFIAVSNVTKDRIISDLGVEKDRIHTIYNGVDPKLFHTPTRREMAKKHSRPTVVYMGRIMAKKGIHFLIKAMPEILNQKPQTRFLFVGGGKITFYHQMVRKAGVPEKAFSFVGHVGYFERTKILREATVFVNPSFFELCSLSILEAMSCGTSVVARNIGGNPEIIKSMHNGILVPRLDNQELTSAVVSLLQDEKLNRRIGREARKTIERSFTSRRCARETYEVYKKIVND